MHPLRTSSIQVAQGHSATRASRFTYINEAEDDDKPNSRTRISIKPAVYFTLNSQTYPILIHQSTLPTKMRAGSLLALALLPSTFACSPPKPRSDNSTSKYPYAVPGPDDASDPATTGYLVNHVGINVNNMTRSMDFYIKVFGMRHMFTYHLTDRFAITYLAHSSGGKNGTGYQTTEELIRFKNNDAGKLELVHFDSRAGEIPGSPERTSTISHLGIIVPDMAATLARLEEYGVTIYKRPGEPMPTEGYLANPYSIGDASKLSAEEFAEILAVMGQLNTLNIFAADPDGNLLEIMPLDEPNLFG